MPVPTAENYRYSPAAPRLERFWFLSRNFADAVLEEYKIALIFSGIDDSLKRSQAFDLMLDLEVAAKDMTYRAIGCVTEVLQWEAVATKTRASIGRTQ